MASAAPALGEVSVGVHADIERLLSGFKNAEAAADKFDRALQRRVGQSAASAQKATDALGAAEQRLSRSFDQAGRAADRYAVQMQRARNETTAAAASTDRAMASIRRTLLGSASIIAAALGANKIRLLADDYTQFTNRLRAAGLEGEKLHGTQEQLFELAQRYGVQMSGLGTLYGRITQAQKELGASNKEIGMTVEGTAAALRLYGAGTQESRGALIQLTQLLGGVKVQAQEFNSINDGARPILIAAANGIGRYGGSISKMRLDVINGNLTVKEFFQGLQKGLPDIIARAQEMPLTIGASFEVLNNALGRYIGQTDQALGATQRISLGLAALARNLDTIMPILGAIILAIGAKYAAAAGLYVAAQVRKIAVDASATLGANFLAASTGRVTTTLGAARTSSVLTATTTTRLTAAFTGAGVAANVAAGSVTRMQLVMATAGAMAKGLGGAILSAFGGWVGVAIMAIVGSVILYERAQARAKQETADFNAHQKTGARLLAEEAQQARTAKDEIKGLGQQHQTATGYVKAFAGATGDAADALHRQATEARNARIELLKHAAAQAEDDAAKANAAATERADTVLRRKDAISPQDDPQYRSMLDRATKAQDLATRLRAAADTAGARPLESWVSPNTRTQGRDLVAEVADLQTQLVAAERAHNAVAQRELLKQIKLRKRITELMEQGLSFEIANAQANTEAMPSARTTRDPEQTTPFGNPLAAMNVRHGFGEKRPGHMHGGVDLRAAQGTPVYATARGAVEYAGIRGDYGNLIELKHGRGTTTRYGHLSGMSVASGQTVDKGQLIGYSGGRPGTPGAGNSEAEHLHYEVRRNGRAVNPLKGGGFPTDEGEMDEDAERLQDQAIQREEAYQRDLAGLQADIISARRDQSVDAATIAQMEKDSVNAQRDRNKQEVTAKQQRGELTAAEAAELLEANEQLRTLQLRGVDLKEQQRKAGEASRLLEQSHEAEVTALQAQEDIARTAVERRVIERRIIAAQKEYERKVLQAIIDSPFTTPLDRQLAQNDLGSLDKRYGAKTGALDRQGLDDLRGSAPEGSESAHNQAADSIREQEAERLAIVQEALDSRLIMEEEAARRRVEIERDAQAQIRDLDLAQTTARLEAAQQVADGLQQIAATILGEHSKAARAMFIVSKAFAIAEAALKLQVAIANASAIPFPANIPAIATAVALGASIIANIASIGAQFDSGGWTGSGPRNHAAGTVHGQEYVIRAGPAARHRQLLDGINAGADPTFAMRSGGGPSGGSGGRMSVAIHNHAPGVEHEARQIGPGEIEIIARKVVQRDAPGVVAADLRNPSSRTSKAVAGATTARRKRG